MRKKFIQVAELFRDQLASSKSTTEQERIMKLATRLSAMFADDIDTVQFMTICQEGTKSVNRHHPEA